MISTSAVSHLGSRRRPSARLVKLHATVFSVAEQSVWPVFELLLRIWLAQSFAMTEMMHMLHVGGGASVSAPHGPVAAYLSRLFDSPWGLSLQFAATAMLALGFLTPLAALALLLVGLATAASPPLDAQLLVWALLAWYAVSGAGRLSVDRALGGLASSALPLAQPLLRATAWLRCALTPLYQLLLRAWLALALAFEPLLAHGMQALMGGLLSAHAIPFASAPQLEFPLTYGAAVLLLTGTATRYIALALILLISIGSTMKLGDNAGFYWILALALIALRGPGRWSIDSMLESRLRRIFPELEGKPAFALEGLPRVVIVGAGFGGLSCAQALRGAPVAVTLIDRANHHLFQPLLYQVATASLSPGDIAAPIRPLFRDAFNVRVLYGTVTGVDSRAQYVELGSTRVPYDFLVLACGATHGYFGKDEWQTLAPGLKRLEDATEIRRRLLTAFERAEVTEDETERRALLTFLIVGGGPTGVELAGAIAELARVGMLKEFRRFDPADSRIVLVQSASRILPSFPETLAAIAQRELEQLGVEVLTGHRVESVDEAGVSVSGVRIPARTVLWAAGVVASPAARWLGAPSDRSGRVIVEPDLSVPGLSSVFAIGDTAASKGWAGRDVPGLAPAAKQGGAYVASTIRARTSGREPPPPFAYRHRGSLATIGRKAAVADFGTVRLWGAPAWWLWGMVHVGLLVGVRNRVATVVNWFWSYLTFESAIRLITGGSSAV